MSTSNYYACLDYPSLSNLTKHARPETVLVNSHREVTFHTPGPDVSAEAQCSNLTIIIHNTIINTQFQCFLQQSAPVIL